MVRWRKLWSLSPTDRFMLVRMTVMLPLIALALRLCGFRRVIASISKFSRKTNRRPVVDEAAQVQRIKNCCRYVKCNGIYRGNCLSRSLMIWWLLRRQGIECDLRIGTRFVEGAFQAHAWVEHQGRPVNAGPRVRGKYSTFDHAFMPHGI